MKPRFQTKSEEIAIWNNDEQTAIMKDRSSAHIDKE